MTTYPYAVTIHCQGQVTVERVIAFGVMDAMMQAIVQFTAAKNIAGQPSDDARVVRVEPDFTVVPKPEASPSISDHIVKAVDALLSGLSVDAVKDRKAKP